MGSLHQRVNPILLVSYVILRLRIYHCLACLKSRRPSSNLTIIWWTFVLNIHHVALSEDDKAARGGDKVNILVSRRVRRRSPTSARDHIVIIYFF